MDNEKIASLLTEIRDSNQQLLAEYRRVANEAVSIQQQAVAIQKESIERQKVAVDTQLRHVRLYKGMIFLIVPILLLVVWELLRLLRVV